MTSLSCGLVKISGNFNFYIVLAMNSLSEDFSAMYVPFLKQKKKKKNPDLSLGNHKHAPQRTSGPTLILSSCMKTLRDEVKPGILVQTPRCWSAKAVISARESCLHGI